MGIFEGIALGIAAGILGFLPLFVALRLSRRVISAGTADAALFGLGGTFVSLVVVIVELIAVAKLAHDILLPFGIAELLALIIATSVYVLYKNVLAKRK